MNNKIVFRAADAAPQTMHRPLGRSARLTSKESTDLKEQWLRGESDALLRDDFFIKALSRQMNTVPSVAEAINLKEQFGCFTGDFDEMKARGRLTWSIEQTKKTFKPLAKRNGGIPVLPICEYANKKIHNGMKLPYWSTTTNDNECGLPVESKEITGYQLVKKHELRLIFSVIKDCEKLVTRMMAFH